MKNFEFFKANETIGCSFVIRSKAYSITHDIFRDTRKTHKYYE